MSCGWVSCYSPYPEDGVLVISLTAPKTHQLTSSLFPPLTHTRDAAADDHEMEELDDDGVADDN
eukprot:4531563-Pyramimonas_sp.AAC.1